MIPERTLQTLEFDKILGQLAEYASFSAGHEAVLALRPATELKAAQLLQQQTAEARSLLEGRPSVHMGGAHDVRGAARRAEVGAILTAAELLEVAGTLGASGRIRSSSSARCT